MKLIKRIAALVLLSTMLLLLCGCSSKQTDAASTAYTSVQQLAGKRIGIYSGTIFDQIAARYIEDPQFEYLGTHTDNALALESGKIDAYLIDEPAIRLMLPEYPKQRILTMLEDDEYGFIFPMTDEGAALRDQFNGFLAKIKADGTIDELDSIWFGSDESKKVVDTDSLTGENGILNFSTETSSIPFVYVKDGRIVGYEIDIAARFCREFGYGLKMTDSPFTGLLAAVSSGKSDFGASCISITEERKETMYFSEPDYIGGIALVVRDGDNAAAPSSAGFTSLEDLAGKRIAMATGAVFDSIVPNYVKDPQFVYVNSFTDACVALDTGKADAYVADEPSALLMLQEYPDQRILEKLTEEEYAFIIGQTERSETLLRQMNEFLARLREDGTMEELKDLWISKNETEQVIDFSGLTGENGTLIFATTTSTAGAPFTYIKDGQFCGYDVDIAVRFCREYGYGITVQDTNVSGMLASLTTGKADFGAACVSVTEERRQSGLIFTDPDYIGGIALVVKSGAPAEEVSSGGVLDSFEKTFIREGRWKLFASGIGITVLITALAVIFGTAIGFLLFLVYRKENRIFNGFMNVIMDILEKTPVVVILMILYYIIFGKSDLNGIWVSVIGFSVMFACTFISTVKVGVMAVDHGQTEASLALGFKDTHSFLRIILPQAAKHFLPNYRGSIVSLLKDTAVVGYIAVQDLTKVGDIVRSRTYEAFFPLIATAVIYFLLAWLLTLLVRRIEFRTDPTHRSRESILKGVKTK